jgi:CMP-N-acetylneuraminic acid synthetase
VVQRSYKILATVCARGGSKGVKNKNIRDLNGKPLIWYSLNLLENNPSITDYVVSTDSEDIIDVVKKLGFEIRFKRPAELAGDAIPRVQAIRHATEWMENSKGTKYDIIVDLGVATPLKSKVDMQKMIEILNDRNASNVLSVTPSDRNPYFNMVEISNNRVQKVKILDTSPKVRQMAPEVYSMNDAFNVWWRETLFSEQPQFNEKTALYVMPRERSIDIDEEIDFRIAELFIKEQPRKS